MLQDMGSYIRTKSHYTSSFIRSRVFEYAVEKFVELNRYETAYREKIITIGNPNDDGSRKKGPARASYTSTL